MASSEIHPPDKAGGGSQIDHLIHEIGPSLGYLSGIENLPAFRDVLSAYLQGHAPAPFEYAASIGYVFTFQEAARMAAGMIRRLFEMRTRWEFHRLGVYVGVEWDRHWAQTKNDWVEKRARLVELLTEAADLFESGQCDPGIFPSLEKYKDRWQSDGLGDVDSVHWCGGKNLRRWAGVVEMTPDEGVFPLAQHHPPGWRVGQFGRRGRASDPDSALRAMVIREIAEYIPTEMMAVNGYSTICDLTAFIGIKGISRQNVRAVLLGGRT
jgi:hypothetical protein